VAAVAREAQHPPDQRLDELDRREPPRRDQPRERGAREVVPAGRRHD
jgi:hypothetical protein